MIKVYALYLPQYYEIEQNNRWWGKGFTEWTNIRKARKETGKLWPLNDNFYNLLDKETMLWQCDLAKQYGVSGFCFYHYWFTNGETILEKPAENLLQWSDIPMNFFFCWANHNWVKRVNGKEEILLHEKYGDKSDWKLHFNYMLPFFSDKRYLKIENKPVFLLYNTNIPKQQEMTVFFKEEAKKHGFDGMYFIDNVFADYKIPSVSLASDAVNIMMPSFIKNEIRKHIWVKVRFKLQIYLNKIIKSRKLIETYDGDRFIQAWKENELLSKIKAGKVEQINGKDVIYSALTMWDNTYRHSYQGSIITKPSREAYRSMLQEIKERSEKNDVQITLINAWNEWAEGMILEPDCDNGFYFLEIVKDIFKGD